MDQEHAVGAGGVRGLLARLGPGQERFQRADRAREIAAALEDRHLEVGGLEVRAVLGEERFRAGPRLVELAHVAQRACLQVETEAVLRIRGQDGFRLLERFRIAARAGEDLAQGQVQADVLGLQLERLAVVQDRLVVLLGARVDVGEGLVGARGGGVELDRLLQRGRRAVRVALGQVLRAELDVGLEAARAQVEEPPPGRDGLVVLLELRIDVAGQDQQCGRVGGRELEGLLVFDGGLAQRLLVVVTLRLHVAELGQDEVRFRARGRGLDRRLRFRQGLDGLARLLEQPRHVRADLSRLGIEPLRLAVLGQGLVEVTVQAGLQGEAVVQVGRRTIGGAIGGGGTSDGEREEKGQQGVVTPKRMILTRARRTSQRRRERVPCASPAQRPARPRVKRGIRPGSSPSRA